MPSKTPFWARPPFVVSAILAYLAVHFAVRMALWPTLATDDAEQALFAQQFAWTYRYRAPPLFTWMLVALDRIVPVGVVSISLIRYALLGTLLLFIYLAARQLLRDPRLAGLSAYSFAAIHTFSESSHRELTHATALAAALAVAWYVFIRLAASPRLGWYLALGATFGLGMLAKWNFVILAITLPVACLVRREFRPLLLTWKVVPAAALAAVLVLPTAIAVLRAGPPPGEDLQSVFSATSERGLEQIWRGTTKFLDATIAYPEPLLVLLILLLGLPLWRGLRTEAAPEPGAPLFPRVDIAFIGLTIAAGLALVWAIVPLLGATDMKVRYMYPVLIVAPTFAFMIVERGRPSDRALGVFAVALAILAIAVPIDRLYRGLWVEDCGICVDRTPFGPLSAELRAAGFSGTGTILADGIPTGGNLRVQFPRARIVAPPYAAEIWPPPDGNGQCLVVWSPDDAAASPPEAQGSYLSTVLRGQVDASHVDGVASASMPGRSGRVSRLAYRLYQAANGDCR